MGKKIALGLVSDLEALAERNPPSPPFSRVLCSAFAGTARISHREAHVFNCADNFEAAITTPKWSGNRAG